MSMPVSADTRVERWPTEQPLFILNLLAALALWLVAVVTIIGIVYAVVLGLLIFVIHLAFVAHVRGNGVRVGPDQFPELHASVEQLSRRFGLKRVPETYLIQGGGMLNALATRFSGADIVIVYTDLLEACGDDRAARDMIIGHELGHLACRHLRWNLLLAPALIVPFLFAALSRAREYTCDRYGCAAAGSTEGAVLGLTILAAGGSLGRKVDRRALTSQRASLNTGWMTIGEWLSTHPPLVKRLAQVDPSLHHPALETNAGTFRALGIISAVVVPVAAVSVLVAWLLPQWLERLAPDNRTVPIEAREFQPPPADIGKRQVDDHFQALASFIRAQEAAGRGLPWDTPELYERWNAGHRGEAEPIDPFDGTRYAYEQRGSRFRLISVGPDGDWDTDDDLVYDSSSPSSTVAAAKQ